jgi:DMSO/TMAO reductase YedYZ molybdopterin-dependent catalytic subunit
MNDLRRRDFLAGSAILGGRLLVGGLRAEGSADPRISRSEEPLNLEMPFAGLKDFLTPTGLHYVRNHYPIPKIEADAFVLEVSGAVDKPLKLKLADLLKLKSVTRPVTLECAGNGRSFLPVKVKGVQWAQGAVSTAEWSGVPLADILKLAGVKKGAVEVILDSADKGDPKKDGQPAAPLTFARSLTLAKALRPEVLLAHAMNGKPLPPAHGAPLRAVVPGWYGCASVKWLTRVIVTKEPFAGFDQTLDYAYWRKGEDGLPRLTAITEMEPKAQIARPAAGSELAAGKEARLSGAAWAGEPGVAKVEVSADGGKLWREVTLLGKAEPFCWRLWEAGWTPRAAGKAVLMARATDGKGRTQPTTHDAAGRKSYIINFVQAIPVTVK